MSMTPPGLPSLLKDVRACNICAADLPFGPRPVVQAATSARILIVGQAPGRRVHDTGIPFNDPSGDRLRDWMGIDRDIFYDPARLAILPMGFCFPGTGKSGDLPPRPECAAHWRQRLLDHLPRIALTLIIGQYAMDWHLGKTAHKTVTEKVRHGRTFGADKIVLPHPSPRNNIWLKKNPWFESDVLPDLKSRVRQILDT
nr:uracil-DNA glycosylase family protein [Paremcibacter congregatus]